MNLTDFRRVTELAKLAECGITLTAAEAEWLLEGVELSKKALESSTPYQFYDSCWACHCFRFHAPDCPRQLALAHWSEP